MARIMYAVAIGCCVSSGCRDRSPNAGDVHTTTDAPLPESSSLKGTPETILAAQIEYARGQVDRIGPRMGSGVANSVVPLGQSLAARRLLNDPVLLMQRPMVLLAYRASRSDGYRQLSLDWINPNRETTTIIVLLRGPDGAVVQVSLRNELDGKKEEVMIRGAAWQIDAMSWDQLRTLATADHQGRFHVENYADRRVPYPFADDLVQGCVAVEDRSGRVSDFVPILRFELVDRTIETGSKDVSNPAGQ